MSDAKQELNNRIRKAYGKRDSEGKRNLYSWWRQDSIYMESVKRREFAEGIKKAFGEDIHDLCVLDVGCGTGGFLRLLAEYGVDPKNLVGTELLEDRLNLARKLSMQGMNFVGKDIQSFANNRFDLVSAHTVLSSVLDSDDRTELILNMWSKVKIGGWLMVFDFKVNNPKNPDVLKINRKDIDQCIDPAEVIYKPVLLAPPITRLLPKSTWFIDELLSAFVVPLRTHFIYMARK